MQRRVFLGCMTAVLVGVSVSHAQEGGEMVFRMSRSMGFRPAGMMNVTSDYSFELKGDGTFSYSAASGVNNEPYVVNGKLPGAIEAWEAEIQKLGVYDIPAPSPDMPIIADAPEINVHRVVDGEPWSRQIEVNGEIGRGLHRMVQQLVMGVVRLDLEGAEPKEMDPRELNEPMVIDSADALAELFGKGGESVAKQVDFKKQQVLVWRWNGSGQDSLVAWRSAKEGETGLSYGVQRGMTRDLREHLVLLAIPKGDEPKFVELPPAKFER